MELLLDPGHELGLPAWSLSGLAARTDSLARSGAWSVGLMSIPKGGMFPNGATSTEAQAMTWLAGKLHTAGIWVYVPSSPNNLQATLRLRLLDPITGIDQFIETRALGSFELDAWEWWAAAPFVPAQNTSTGQINVRLGYQAAGSATCYVDDETVEEIDVPKGYESAYVALYNRLRTINGSAGGYHHDLGGRVLSCLRIPIRDNLKLPTICCPIDSDLPYDDGEDYMVGRLRVIVIFWLKHEEREGIATSDAISVCRAHDDLVKCLMPTAEERPWWDLSDPHILGIELGTPDLLSEQVEFPPRVRLPVILKVKLHPDVLGP